VNSRSFVTVGFCHEGRKRRKEGNAGSREGKPREMVQPVASLQDIRGRWTVKLIAVRALGLIKGSAPAWFLFEKKKHFTPHPPHFSRLYSRVLASRSPSIDLSVQSRLRVSRSWSF